MSGSYPFIDIAALDSIREGFAKGNALLVLAYDLSEVLWVNGPGAKLFGFDRVEDMIGGGLDLPIATRRQIASSNINADGETRTVAVRLGGGLRSDLTRFSVSQITLPDGVSGLLLAVDSKDAEADAIISGLSDDSTHIALIDANSRVIAASPRFAALDISSTTLEDLVIEAADATDRIVKRRIRAGKHSVPGAIARLTDIPPMHLLCIIGDAPVAPVEAPVPLEGEAEEILEEVLPEPVVSKNTENASTDQSKPRSFVFDQDAPPARFIWKVGPDGTISEISPDLAATIGPNAADVVGRRFTDVANVFGFDPDGSIAALLDKRDTWSGKRLMWPVEGTDLRVPVELAALPVYSRDREFTGFRGFGVVRPADAEKDPEEIGLVLAGGIPQARKAITETVETAAPVEDDDVLALGEEVANDDHPLEIGRASWRERV